LSLNDAQVRLKGTLSGDKNEMLFSEFDINYNKEPLMYRKGTVLVRKKMPVTLNGVTRQKSEICETYGDMIKEEFWQENDHLLT